jgi:hypothetical protein
MRDYARYEFDRYRNIEDLVSSQNPWMGHFC